MGKAVDKPIALRYERKFVYPTLRALDIINTEVLCNSYGFREIFHRRSVNNLYLDDQNYSFYRQNVAGDERREKYRFRWYGDDFYTIEKPTLEVKKKMGAVGDKLSFKYKAVTIDLNHASAKAFQEKMILAAQDNGDLLLASTLSRLQPALYNSYERRYFLSACERFRITIDYNMQFYNPAYPTTWASQRSLKDVILELKYAVSEDADARQLSQELSSRLSKNSKYVRGIDLIQHRVHV